MDTEFDPMEDFFNYTSGRWIRQNPVPPDKSSWNSFIELYEANNLKLKEILEDCLKSAESNTDPLRKMLGNFYASAMDTETLEKKRFSPISSYIDEIENVQSLDDLILQVAKLHSNGIFPLFQISSQTDQKNSSVYGLYVYQGGLSLPDRDYYLSDKFREIREKYIAHITKVFSIYGLRPDEAEKSASCVLSVESWLAEAGRSRAELRDAEKNYNRIPVSEIEGKFPNLRLMEYLEFMNVPELDYIIAGQPEFLDSLDSGLKEKPIGDLATYLKWQVINSAAPFLFSEIHEEHFDMFGRTILGQKEQEPRWKRAVRMIDGSVGEALGELYVREYFGEDARQSMALMVNDIREVFTDRLRNLEWMTEETRKRALSKFEKFRTKIGHPDKFVDYSSIEIRKDDYLGNVSRSAAFEVRRQIDRAGSPVDKDEWLMTPPTVNAYFSPPDNEIVFPAGILQPPFFDSSADVAVNYGAIGAVISHEITHGYDDQGRRYDENGNIRDWWCKEDENNFMEKANQVRDLYSSMEVLPGIRVNGELTLGENIADFGGVSIAYEALQRRLEREPSLRTNIDGLTPEQRFFISFGQIWKENILEPTVKMLVTIDPHSPNKFRAALPVYNHDSFDSAFSGLSKRTETAIGRKIKIW